MAVIDKSRKSELRYEEYKCYGCSTKMLVPFWDMAQTAPGFNCGHCGSGFGVDLQEMLAKKQGTYPTGRRFDRDKKPVN